MIRTILPPINPATTSTAATSCTCNNNNGYPYLDSSCITGTYSPPTITTTSSFATITTGPSISSYQPVPSAISVSSYSFCVANCDCENGTDPPGLTSAPCCIAELATNAYQCVFTTATPITSVNPSITGSATCFPTHDDGRLLSEMGGPGPAICTLTTTGWGGWIGNGAATGSPANNAGCYGFARATDAPSPCEPVYGPGADTWATDLCSDPFADILQDCPVSAIYHTQPISFG